MKMEIKLPEKAIKIIVEVCRIVVGGVFVFSGYVKAIDPSGFLYKIQDYLEAFGLSVFNFMALPVSFFLPALEFALGLCLLLGVYRRFQTIVTLLMMLFMTPLTLYLAIANPVTDCGCFGEAFVISNWDTFFKNVVLLAASVVLFLKYKYITPLYSPKSFSLVFVWVWLFVLGLAAYCYAYLPIVDFRPYKIGANIPALMEIPEDAEHDVYETTLIYSKDGVTKSFSMDNFPQEGEGWTFVTSESKLVKKGYEPPITDFAILDEEDEDITDIILSEPTYTFLLVSSRLERADDSNVDKINEIYDYSVLNDYTFYALTASLPGSVNEWRENTGAEYPFCTVDEITLKTMIRSNPGLFLLKEGTIINKWPYRKFPDASQLLTSLEDSPLGQVPDNKETANVLLSLLILLFPLIALFLFDYFHYQKKGTT